MAQRRSSKSKITFKHPVTVEVTRPRFKVSSALPHIDAKRLAQKASVEIEVGKFIGKGCGSTVTAIVKKGKVVQLKVSPCEETIPMRTDPALAALVANARRQLGLSGKPGAFRPVPFARLQEEPGETTIKVITCVQICILGHCFVCCTLAYGGFWCGSTLIIHTDP